MYQIGTVGAGAEQVLKRDAEEVSQGGDFGGKGPQVGPPVPGQPSGVLQGSPIGEASGEVVGGVPGGDGAIAGEPNAIAESPQQPNDAEGDRRVPSVLGSGDGTGLLVRSDFSNATIVGV